MAIAKPGEYITAKCGRCNDVTGHVVMVVVGGEIIKVECKACGSVHKYRETKIPGLKKVPEASVRHVRAGQERDKAVDVGRPRPARINAAPTSRAASAAAAATRRNSVKMESAWQEAMVRHNAEKAVPYSMGTAFAVGDYIEHPVFGRGEAIAVSRPDKVDILFQQGVKTLRCKL